MYELAKSMLNYSWELALNGAEHLFNRMSPVDAGYVSKTVLNLAPRQMSKMMADLIQQTAHILGGFMPLPESRLAWRELNNKLEAFDTFEHVDVILELPKSPDLPLRPLVEQAEELGPYRAPWALEGLGRYYADAQQAEYQLSQPLLTAAGLATLPAWSLIPLHVGMGLSLAERAFATMPAQPSPAAIQSLVLQLVGACQHHAQPGYEGAAFEPIGLVARLMYPHWIPAIDQQLRQLSPVLTAYFWHGIGRGIYFLPFSVPPGMNPATRAVEIARAEPSHELAQRNTLAGLIWAISLVNLRHPEILLHVLQRHAATFADDDAFCNGVSSAILVWHDIKPDDPYLHAFYMYEPDRVPPEHAKLWNTQVRAACRTAIRDYNHTLKSKQGFGDLFRYQSLPDLVHRLNAASEHDPLSPDVQQLPSKLRTPMSTTQ
jgi:hypothetical protein